MLNNGLEPMGRDNPDFDNPHGYMVGMASKSPSLSEALTPESAKAVRGAAMAPAVSEMQDRHFPWLTVGVAIGYVIAAGAVVVWWISFLLGCLVVFAGAAVARMWLR